MSGSYCTGARVGISAVAGCHVGLGVLSSDPVTMAWIQQGLPWH